MIDKIDRFQDPLIDRQFEEVCRAINGIQKTIPSVLNGSITLSVNNYWIKCPAGGSVTMPDVAQFIGQAFVLTQIEEGIVTVIGPIMGTTNMTMNAYGMTLVLKSDGTNWMIV